MVKRERSSSAKKDRKRSKSENADKNGTSAVEEEAVKRQASNQQEQQEDVKPKINSNKKKAKKLGHSNGTLFFRKRIELAVSLLPGSLRNCQEAVEDSIRGLLMKYSEGLGGIMMGYENVKLIGNKKGQGRGWILNELPYIHYNASCDALVFHPSIGYELYGIVNECRPSHVGVLVFNYFNAMISGDQLRAAGFTFDADLQNWSSGAGTISTEDKINFVVEKVHECDGTVSLEGAKPSLSLLVEAYE